MRSMYKHTCRHTHRKSSSGISMRHECLLLTMPIKLHTVYIKALQNKDRRSLGQKFCSSVCIMASRLSFCFCLTTKARPSPCWFFTNSVPLPRPVRKSGWSQMIRSTPVQASGGQRASTVSLLWPGDLPEEERQRKS